MAQFIDEQKAIEQNHFEKERKEREIKRAQVCLTSGRVTRQLGLCIVCRFWFTIQPVSWPVDMITHMARVGGGAAPQARRD
jgi:hypothetical protein